MGIIYNKLFHFLLENHIKKGELQKEARITATIMARLAKNESVRTETIGKICQALRCQPGDIMEYIEVENMLDKDGKETRYNIVVKPILYEKEIEQIEDRNQDTDN